MWEDRTAPHQKDQRFYLIPSYHVPAEPLHDSLERRRFNGVNRPLVLRARRLTDLWTAGAAEPEQLWSWWKGSDPAAYLAGRRLHRELGPSHPPPPLPFSALEGELWRFYRLNLSGCLDDYTRALQEFHLLPLCVVWTLLRWDGVWACHRGSCGDGHRRNFL